MKKRVKRITAVILSISLLTLCTPVTVNTPVSTPKVAEAAKKKTIVVKEKSNASINKAKKKCWKLFKANRPFELRGKNNDVNVLGEKFNGRLKDKIREKIYKYIIKKAIKSYTSLKCSKWFVNYMVDEVGQYNTYDLTTKKGIKFLKTELKAINKICKKLKTKTTKALTTHANAIKTGQITESQVKAQVFDEYMYDNTTSKKGYYPYLREKTYQYLSKGKLPVLYSGYYDSNKNYWYPGGWQVSATIVGKLMGYNMLNYHNLDGSEESYYVSCMLVTDIDGTKYWYGIINDSYTYAIAKKETVKVKGKKVPRCRSGLYDYKEKCTYEIEE